MPGNGWQCSVMSNRIREIREANGLSRVALAKRVGCSDRQIIKLERGERRLTQEWMERIGAGLGVSPAELIAPKGRDVVGLNEEAPRLLRESMVEVDGAELAAVPRYDAALSAGPGSIIDPNAEPIGHWFIEAQWLRAVTQTAPSRLAVLRVSGDSMEDTLADGDWVLVDRGQTRASHEGVYALQVDDSTWVKRLTVNLRDRLVRIISDNPRYPVQELPEKDLTVIGRIVWIVARKV